MRLGTGMLLAGSLVLACAFPLLAGAQSQTRIAASGTTLVHASFPKGGKVTVNIQAARLEGACAENYPAGREWMSLGFKELSVVREMTISVNNHRVFVPPSAYGTLFALNTASVRLDGQSFVLRVEGADGAYSYVSLIYFDAKRVNMRKVYSGMDLESPIEVTRYYTVTVGP